MNNHAKKWAFQRPLDPDYEELYHGELRDMREALWTALEALEKLRGFSEVAHDAYEKITRTHPRLFDAAADRKIDERKS